MIYYHYGETYEKYFQKRLLEDDKIIQRYISDLFPYSRRLNSFSDNFLCKLNVLTQARNFGLKIPKSLFTNNIQDLIDCFFGEQYIFCKNFTEKSFSYFDGNNSTHVVYDYSKILLSDIVSEFSDGKISDRLLHHFFKNILIRSMRCGSFTSMGLLKVWQYLVSKMSKQN